MFVSYAMKGCFTWADKYNVIINPDFSYKDSKIVIIERYHDRYGAKKN